MTFNEWKRAVDEIFFNTIGCSSDDVEDYGWWSCFDDGMTPAEAFKEWDIETNYTAGLCYDDRKVGGLFDF